MLITVADVLGLLSAGQSRETIRYLHSTGWQRCCDLRAPVCGAGV